MEGRLGLSPHPVKVCRCLGRADRLRLSPRAIRQIQLPARTAQRLHLRHNCPPVGFRRVHRGAVALCDIACGAGWKSPAQNTDPFGRLLAAGIVAMFAIQVIVNVAMTLGLMPITGLTLPFLSYGGSSLLVSMLCVGLLNNVGRWRPFSSVETISRSATGLNSPRNSEISAAPNSQAMPKKTIAPAGTHVATTIQFRASFILPLQQINDRRHNG